MTVRTAARLAGTLALGLALCALGTSAAQQPPREGYSPVAGTPALQAAAKQTLKALADWVDQKDYQSAVETNRELVILAQLLDYQSKDKAHRDAVAAFRADVEELNKAFRAKEDRRSRDLLKSLTARIDKLPAPPAADKVSDAAFKPTGGVKTWMLMMDSLYAESKRADAQELQLLTSALAEEANAAAYLRGDAKWRKTALDTRDEALKVSKTAADGDAHAARAGLKKVYQACESCHQATKR